MSERWRVLPLRDLVTRVVEKNGSSCERALTVSAERGLVEQEQFFNKRVASSNLSGYWLVQPGDYVYNKSYSAAAPLGVVARNRDSVPGVVSPLYIVMRPKSELLEDAWLDLAFQSSEYSESLAGLLKEGGRAHGALNVKLDDYFGALLPVPPRYVQRRIVDLVSKIDEAILAAEREILAQDLVLAATREALLEPGQSGWESLPLSQLTTKIGSGATPRGGESSYKEVGTALIRSQNVHDLEFAWPGLARIDDGQADELANVAVQPGDVLINITGASVNRVCEVPESVLPARVNQHVAILRPEKSLLDPAFLVHVLRRRDLKAALDVLAGGGTTRQALTKSQLEAFEIPIPAIDEQRRICAVLESIATVIARSRVETNLLRNFKVTATSRLLTGHHAIPQSYDLLLEEVA